MANDNDNTTCTVICWVIAAVAGIILFLILSGLGMGTFLAIILTLIGFVALGWWLAKTFCTADPAQATIRPSASAPAAAARTGAGAGPCACGATRTGARG